MSDPLPPPYPPDDERLADIETYLTVQLMYVRQARAAAARRREIQQRTAPPPPPQRDAVDALGTALVGRETTETARSDGDEPPPCASLVR
ncbi:hypothetical protein ACFT5C_32570 [Streptomyces sp. NPDC057116]|uniref:hypothetical protein n=1 Tax=Streptomyces sp. NPDC057116 TaxID=3346023 RepID=UPI003644FE6B